MKTVYTILKYATFTACAYEAVAGFTGDVPTISSVVGLHLWLGLPILVGLGVHFYWSQLVGFFKALSQPTTKKGN